MTRGGGGGAGGYVFVHILPESTESIYRYRYSNEQSPKSADSICFMILQLQALELNIRRKSTSCCIRKIFSLHFPILCIGRNSNPEINLEKMKGKNQRHNILTRLIFVWSVAIEFIVRFGWLYWTDAGGVVGDLVCNDGISILIESCNVIYIHHMMSDRWSRNGSVCRSQIEGL